MEPHSYIRVCVAALALRVPLHTRICGGGQVHSASIPAYAELSLGKLPIHTAPVPLVPPGLAGPDVTSSAIAATFYLDERSLTSLFGSKSSALVITLKMASQPSCCGRGSGVVLGRFELPVERDWEANEPFIAHGGWASIGKRAKKGSADDGMELHAVVRIEPDPRLMFEFDGATTRSPQILQVHGDSQQPLFSIKFCTDRGSRPSMGTNDTLNRTGWDALRASVPFGMGGGQGRERKGWLAMIHDLNGTPVAAASMVTPFVPSSGTEAVSKSNPGAWLLLRPEVDQSGNDTWRAWGKLEAWKEKKGSNAVLRLSVVDGDGSSMPASQVVVAEATINPSKGGVFRIQGKPKGSLRMPVLYPADASGKPSPALTLSQAWLSPQTGFVMSAYIRGDRNKSCPTVNVSMRQVATVGDAAMFMALAAAVDLCIEACLPFRGSG